MRYLVRVVGECECFDEKDFGSLFHNIDGFPADSFVNCRGS